jgi:hypothetical protein
MLNRPAAWATLLLVATFAAGIVVGVGGRALWVRAAYGGAPERGRGVEPLVAELTDELALTPVQRDTVHAILQRHFTRMAAVWDTVRPRFDALRAEMDSEVTAHLSPEQQEKYRDHMARHRHQREKTDSSGKKR